MPSKLTRSECGAPRVHRDTPVLTKWEFDQIFEFAWYRIWPMPKWAPYSFEDKEQFRNALWTVVEELLREGNRTQLKRSA
jgi:hypothetical protein